VFFDALGHQTARLDLKSRFHFLTDIEELFKRYKDNNVKVMASQSIIDAAKDAILQAQ
jgi:hypothetical protein